MSNKRVKITQKTHDFRFGALFRRDLSPKPAAERLYKLINETWHTELEATTDAEGYVTVRGFFGDYELEYEGGSIRFGIHKDK